MVSQFLSLVVTAGIGNPGAQTCHFAPGMLDTEVVSICSADCPFVVHAGTGDRFPSPLLEQ